MLNFLIKPSLIAGLLLGLITSENARGADTNEIPGVTAVQFFRAVDWSARVKSEFESQQDYINRINASFKWTGTPVWVELGGHLGRFAYDAENKKATVGVPCDFSGLVRPKDEDRFMVFSTNWFAGVETLSNDLGSQFQATNYEGIACDFALENFRKLPKQVKPKIPGMNLGLVFPIEPQKARALKESKDSELCFLVRVESLEHAEIDEVGTPAIFESPNGLKVSKQVLPARLLGIRVINRATGEVLAEWVGDKKLRR